MKRSWKDKKYLKKMIFSYAFLVSLTAFVLTIFFYHNYSEILIKNLYADYQSNLKKNAQTFTDLCSEADQLYTTIVIDNQVDKYSSLKEFDPAENYLTFLSTKKLLNINPYLHSICIYNVNAMDAVYCGSRQFDLDTGWEKLNKAKAGLIYTNALLEGSGNELLTFAHPVFIETYEELAGGIFINFNYDRVVKHVLGETDYTQLVLDNNNQLLLEKPYGEAFISTDSLSEVFSWADKKKEQTGSDIIKLGGRNYVISYYKDEINGIKFISYLDYNDVIKLLREQRNFFLLTSLFVMLVSIYVLYLISRRLYKPIGTITSELKNSKYANENGRDEFDLILNVYENAVTEIELLEEKNASYLPKMRAELIRTILSGNCELELTAEKQKEQGWNIPFQGMFIACITIEEWLENSLRLAVVQARMKQLLQEYLGKLFYAESVSMDNNDVVCLINTLGDNNVTFDNLVNSLEQVKNIIIEEYKIKITIGLDGMVTELNQCSAVYKKVKNLQNYKFVLGYNQVIYPKRVMELLPEPLTYPDKIISEIMNHMVLNEKKEFEEKLDDFIETIRQYTYQTASMMLIKLYLESAFRLQQLGIQGIYMTDSVTSTILPKTLEDGKDMMMEVFEAFRSRKQEAEQLKSNKHYKKIEESKEYIMNNYKNPNLSLDMMAELYGYSTNYFARIFKTITGFYINDYIRQVRIMKAQELLLKSDMTIVDIASATGFTTPNYFYSIFKKETGLTPAAYRNVKE